MNKIKYDGTDFSSEWKVVTYEGRTISAQWAYLTDSKTKEILGVVVSEKDARPLTGFNNYRWAAQAARMFGGVAIRK